MKISKADFKAMREMVGMSQSLLAKRLGVTTTSVKRWERPDFDHEPPQDAWDIILAAREQQKKVVDYAIKKAKGLEMQMGNASKAINLTYWRSEEEYENAHPGEGENWQMANANSRLAAHELEMMKYEVDFNFPGLKEALKKGAN